MKKPSEFLVENVDLLPQGKVLDVAMGEGRNAIYLAERGYQVEGVDISKEAIEKCLGVAQERGLKIKDEVANLERDYRIKSNEYDLIICFNYLQRNLIPQIKSALKVGGIVVYETFTIDQPGFGKPKNKDFLLKHNELLELFRDLRILRYREGIIDNKKAIASLIAQKY